ncbi:hypothetical protein DFH09DRAFT_1159585, partial [Mycena vulgaris]
MDINITGRSDTFLSAPATGKGDEMKNTGRTLRHRLSRVLSRVRKEHRSTAPGLPTRLLPELPPELWILILEYSTYPSLSSPFASSPSASLEFLAPALTPAPSFLAPALTPASLAPRLAHYRASMRHKRNLALVSREWNAYAQPVLYAFVWLASSAQASRLALTLLCQACCLPPPASASSSSPASASAAAAAASSPAAQTAGRFIRRLHIETPALGRCAPADLRTILA